MSDWKKAAIQMIREIPDELEADINLLIDVRFKTTVGDNPETKVTIIEIHQRQEWQSTLHLPKQKIELPPEVEYENIL